jgi:activator of HSP90 ATPase
MTVTITESITFKNTTPLELFDMFLDSEKHEEITGLAASMSNKEGDSYSVFDRAVFGKNLRLAPGKLIVQSWRAMSWPEEYADSVLILNFSQTDDEAQIDMIHANIPNREYPHIDWDKHYWKPWKELINKRAHTV